MISLPDLNVSLGVIVVKRIPTRVTLMMLVGRQPWDVNLVPMTYPLDFWIFFFGYFGPAQRHRERSWELGCYRRMWKCCTRKSTYL